ncbi:MAG: 16S rRNA (cytosine(1402)-N(4))-methyltransferase RsmH [Bacteroidales bacterium]|uniref:16S rRNA (cytosine(1402)-N(4))-methyltransferase RsmH n=1 Tax=Porphyromonas sp. TaxID=1924944 RepID=UPI002976D8AB|nr:16S rRNA (cytosine(1402)-N(4))-methyltransferase RsmH [Porphyromonas sp.]MDD7438612.1 16S rRNA (cytosine(1402)-N(4))-methyltransferase RsmH [Bacteroidales bacterium]MDY3067868.1 16S rRNA (cytosine(1402)-N(4))-methyltransferase RsmH [Porphyromonas sp.]
MNKQEIIRAEGYHIPVLLHESVDLLVTNPSGIYLDCTFGGGGHSRYILERLSPDGHLFGFDRDPDALANCSINDDRFTFVRSNFRYLRHFMDFYGIGQVDGILADLGLSSHHLDDESRGFSFRFDAPLDMRMNSHGGKTAAQLVIERSQEELGDILANYAELKGSYRIATLLKRASDDGRLKTIQDLLIAVAPIIPERDKKSLAKLFQGLRIAVNDEIGALRQLLSDGSKLLRPEGRFVVITYHSLEDRPVKNFFRTGNISGERVTDHFGVSLSPISPLQSKPILPSADEEARNPRSRSAKLRVGVKK